MRLYLYIVPVVALALSSSACQKKAPEPILVAAAISLKSPLEELAARYEETHHPARHVTFTFGASGDLARQIKQGAPVAIFASAARETAESLVSAGLLTPTCVLATGTLVLIRRDVPELANLTWQTLAQDPALVHLAIGLTPSVPAGLYAEESLRKLGVIDVLEPKLVRGANARSLIDMVAHGESDAAIVYATDAHDAKARGDHLIIVGEPPPNASPRVEYSLGVVHGSDDAADAAAYFCAADSVNAFTSRGFGPR